MMDITNLCVEVQKKPVLNGVNLHIEKKKVYALLGPNGSGKSSLAQTMLGNPLYNVTGGNILFEKKSITLLSPEQRVKLGLALSVQTPPAVKGVTLFSLLKFIDKKYTKQTLVSDDLLNRDVNVGFSGGEKKLSEFLQIIALKPKLVIFDEIDSGLDLANLEKIARLIKTQLIAKNVSVILITHSGNILQLLKPDVTHVMLDGKIICGSKKYQEVLETIKTYGYEKCRECPLLAS